MHPPKLPHLYYILYHLRTPLQYEIERKKRTAQETVEASLTSKGSVEMKQQVWI